MKRRKVKIPKITIIDKDGKRSECISFNCPGLEEGGEYYIVGVRDLEDGDLDELGDGEDD
jgi:hypothetical protein